MSVFGVALCGVSVGMFKFAALGVNPFQSLMSGLDAVIPIRFGTLYVIVNAVLLLFALIFDRKKIRYSHIYKPVSARIYRGVFAGRVRKADARRSALAEDSFFAGCDCNPLPFIVAVFYRGFGRFNLRRCGADLVAEAEQNKVRVLPCDL